VQRRNMKIRKWKTLHSEPVYRTPIFDLHRRRAGHPHRGERDFYVLEAPAWVNIIPLTAAREVVMVRQWRHGIADFTLEVPGGMVDPADPSPLQAARREMREETGYDSARIVELGRVHPNPAIQPNVCYSFLARGVRRTGTPQFDSAEETEVVLVPMREIKRLIASGEIMHALTIAAFSFFHLYNPPARR
jgi:ADP-ribose diphosphatase